MQSDLGIILGSGRQDEIERIVGLECGADEYVTKPFNPRKILARAKNLIRRVKQARAAPADAVRENVVVFAGCTLHIDRRRLAFSEEPLVADPVVLFVRRDRQFPFAQWSDLAGKTVGLLLGDSFDERFDRFAEARLKVERVSSSEQNVRKLMLGRIDFMPVGLRTWRLQGQWSAAANACVRPGGCRGLSAIAVDS